MPRIIFKPEYFGPHMGPTFSVRGSVTCGWDEIAHAAITVGRRNWPDVIQHGTYSVLEALWRLALVRANLVQDANGVLMPSQAFMDLDRSEKGAVSYFLGMCFSKLFADRLFQVPWLLHLDVYRQRIDPAFALPLRPDFVGVDANRDWLVLESKGRSWQLPTSLMTTAKRQTRSLRRIGGVLPALRVAVGSYFTSAGVTARIWDPDDFAEDAMDLSIEPHVVAREYYRPLLDYLNATPHERVMRDDGTWVVRAELPGMDASIAIDEDVLDWSQGRRSWDDVVPPRAAFRPPIAGRLAKHRGEEVGPESRHDLLRPEPRRADGVGVELGASWREELMRRQPGDRAG